MRLGLTCLALLSASTAASAQQPVRQRMSAEGQAVFEQFYSQRNPQLEQCVKDRKAIEQQLDIEGKREPFNWAAAKRLINAQAELQSKCSDISRAQTLGLMEKLPVSDRVLLYRDFYSMRSPPQIKLVETPKKPAK